MIYPFPHFIGFAVEFCERSSAFILHFITDVVIYPCSDWSWQKWIKGPLFVNIQFCSQYVYITKGDIWTRRTQGCGTQSQCFFGIDERVWKLKVTKCPIPLQNWPAKYIFFQTSICIRYVLSHKIYNILGYEKWLSMCAFFHSHHVGSICDRSI